MFCGLPTCWLGAAAGLAPGRENPVDIGLHPVAGGVAGQTGHEQCVVTGVLVAYRGGHGQSDGVFVEGAACCGPAYPAAASEAGVPGYGCGTRAWASREEPGDLGRQPGLEVLVCAGAPYPVAFATPGTGVLVG